MNYNKAVRDKIPEIIEKSGSKYHVKTLSDIEFLKKLEEKLNEEVAEYQSDKNPEELADILEVINRIAELKGISKEKLDQIRIKKSEKKGGFKDNIFLIDIIKSE
ncbi:MAG: nucleoside triphosphate pyrophosphohydrolase [Candidatus Nitrosopelagicus sp.]|nr:nucleoside triphosphate pyrophosphohydrolase [Candidatus Nitrosopelagicus sp.]